MNDLKYIRPQNKEQALAFLQDHSGQVKVIAGGTDLMVQLYRESKNLAETKFLLDISHLSGLDQISEGEAEIKIGALVTHTEMSKYPLTFLAKAAGLMGSPQIRNRGTIGGNIVNACPAADTVYPLVALNATVRLERLNSERVIPLDQLITGPYRTDIAADELLTEIHFRKPPANAVTSFVRLARREAAAVARLQVAVLAVQTNGVVTDLRIAPGSVLPAPARVSAAEEVLVGKRPSEKLIAEAAEIVARKMVAMSGRRWSTPYKEPVIIGMTQEALHETLEVV